MEKEMKNFLKISLFFVVLGLYLLGLPTASWAQEGVQVWTTLGPYGGQIYDIEIDPANPDKMFAGSYSGDGLFVTTDGGNNWQAVVGPEEITGEDTFKNHAVYAVKIAPSNSNVVWAAHNHWVEKSTDGGQTWYHIWNGWMQSPNYDTCSNCPAWDQFRFCKSLAIHPSDPQTVFVGTAGRYTGYEPCGAIYRTEDGGDTWTKMDGPDDSCYPGSGNFDYEVVDLAIDDSNPDVTVVWAVTSNGGVFAEEAGPGDRIADGTLYRGEINKLTGDETWTEVFSMDGGEFYDVEVKPNDPNSIFTANDWGIFRHYFEGGVWKYQWILNLSQEPPLPGAVFARNVRALAFDAKNPDVLYAAWKNSHSQWEGIDTRAKVARGTPPYENANWEIYTADLQFFALAVHPVNSEKVFGGELFRGVYKSLDHGQSWTPVNKGINALLVYDVEADPNDATHLIAATSTGVHEKRGSGDWVSTSDFEYTAAFSVAFDPTDASTYYAGTQNYLAKTTNSGGDWTLSEKLDDDSVNDIAIGPDGSTVFIATRKVGGASGTAGVYRNNNGLSTPTLTEVLSSDRFGFNVVAIDPSDPDHIFAGGGNYSGTRVLGNLYESANGGQSWTLTGLTNVIVNALLIDPRDSKIMYAGCGYSGGTLVPLYKSTDGGVTWRGSHEGIPWGGIQGIGVWGTSGTDVFVVGGAGNILNYDGIKWSSMNSPTIETLYYAWGTSGTDVFAVGANGTILHYDGSRWSTMESGTTEYLRGLWGTSGKNVFAVGNNGTMLHYDGSTWSQIDVSGLTTEHFRNVWGSSGSDIFASGYSGTILHYDGIAWEEMDTGTEDMILGLWGTSGSNVFAVGGNGIILHYDSTNWTPMVSGTTEELQGVWGTSGSDVFAVGRGGTIVHYDGSSWTQMDSGRTDYIWRVWGSSGTDVFAVGDDSTLLHYDGTAWSNMVPPGASWNSVTDLEFHRENKDIVYASTKSQGVYLSPNQGRNWVNLGTPDYDVGVITTSSLYAGTQAGLLQCTGTGVVAGKVTDSLAPALGVDEATVTSNLPVETISIRGLYMMVHPAGEFEVTASAEGYIADTAGNFTVLGGDVTWGDISMKPDLKIVDVLPHPNAGIDDSTRVPHDTSFAVLIHDDDGIDITTDPANINIEFTINDGVNAEYFRDLNHPTLRGIKLEPGEADTAVTRLWVVYDRSNDNDYGNAYEFEKVVSIKIDATDVTGNLITPPAEYRFKTETAAEHADAQARVPETEPVAPTDPDLGSSDYEGIQITSGPLEGAKIIYKKGEPVTPKFGPLETLPTLNIDDSQGVGVPLSLQPHTVFESPVKIFLPCPAFEDVSPLSVCVLRDKWEVACDADGNVLSAGVGWIEPDSRENYSYGNPSMIRLRVYHFSAVQAASNTALSTPDYTRSSSGGGSGGGGGGCFIATYMESHRWLKRPVGIILYPVIGLAWLMLSTSTIAKGFIGLCLLAVWLGASKRLKAGRRALEVR